MVTSNGVKAAQVGWPGDSAMSRSAMRLAGSLLISLVFLCGCVEEKPASRAQRRINFGYGGGPIQKRGTNGAEQIQTASPQFSTSSEAEQAVSEPANGAESSNQGSAGDETRSANQTNGDASQAPTGGQYDSASRGDQGGGGAKFRSTTSIEPVFSSGGYSKASTTAVSTS